MTTCTREFPGARPTQHANLSLAPRAHGRPLATPLALRIGLCLTLVAFLGALGRPGAAEAAAPSEAALPHHGSADVSARPQGFARKIQKAGRSVVRVISRLPLMRKPAVKKAAMAAALVGAAWFATTVLTPASAAGGLVAGVMIGQPLSRMYSNVTDQIGGQINQLYYEPGSPAQKEEHARMLTVADKHKDFYTQIHQDTQATLTSPAQWGKEIMEKLFFGVQPALLTASTALKDGEPHRAAPLLAHVARQAARHYPQVPRNGETFGQLRNITVPLGVDPQQLKRAHDLAAKELAATTCPTEQPMALEVLGSLLGHKSPTNPQTTAEPSGV